MPPAAPLLPEPALPELLARCRQGEAAAQWALYARFAGPMLRLCQRYAPALADAEDVLQDAFVKVFQKLPDQRDPAAFAGWVRRIVVRTAIDAWHHRQVRRAGFELDDAHHLPAPDASALDRLAVDEVRALIDQLPDGCRLVLLLHTVEGYAHHEIAAALGITESTSTGQLARARQRLTVLARAATRERRPAPGTAGVPSVSAIAAAPAAELRPFNPLTALLFQ